MLGEFDFDELQASHWLLGPLFFFAFITFCVFVVANVIIAIIVESYHDARHAVDTEYVDSCWRKTIACNVLLQLALTCRCSVSLPLAGTSSCSHRSC
jgi:hypothetical protein